MHRPSLHRNWFSVQDAKGNFAWKLVTTQKTKYRYLYTHPTWRCFEYTLMTHTHSFWCIYCQLWTYFTPCSSVFIVNFEQVNAGWVMKKCLKNKQTSMPNTWSGYYLAKNLGDFPKTLQKIIQEEFKKEPCIKKTC